jgi:predicted transcriptional regulator
VALFDYIKLTTGVEKVIYHGFEMGTSMFLIASLLKDTKAKMEASVSLLINETICYLNKTKDPLVTNIKKEMDLFISLIKSRDMYGVCNESWEIIKTEFCNEFNEKRADAKSICPLTYVTCDENS